MNIRAQVSSVFHLDKCIGCHTCSIACKNLWTDRKGAEYMWWNNVETKPGTGYPTKWEDQEQYQGGWERSGNDLKLRSGGRGGVLGKIFHNPKLPTMDDYYEPFTFQYGDLTSAPAGNDQPTARPISMVSGQPMKIEAGPNWDDDLSGSNVYAANDPGVVKLSAEEQAQMFAIEKLVMFHLPRICNHCLNPSCVAACPSGALYKRGEDGIVLLDQTRCRAWRACVSACPYKKTYYNWQTGKSEKCILCFPRLETGQAPACFHSCVGRIRYLGVLLYDASRIEAVACLPDDQIVEGQRSLILDPFDPEVIAAARDNGLHDSTIQAAQESPVYKFVKVWKIALPPHLEFRTLPMLFYVPPLLPVISSRDSGHVENLSTDLFNDIDQARMPIAYLARLLGAGNEGLLRYALRKQLAVRIYRRALTVGDIDTDQAARMLAEVDSNVDQAESIYKLTSLATFDDRFVIPPAHREEAIEMMQDPLEAKQEAGFGFRVAPRRGL